MAGLKMCGPSPAQIWHKTLNRMKFNGCGLMALINVIFTLLFMISQILTPDITEIKLDLVSSLCIKLVITHAFTFFFSIFDAVLICLIGI